MGGFLEDGSLLGQIGRLILAPATITTIVVLALIPILRWARRVYFRRHLQGRLFSDPWINLSGDSSLDMGASLAELLYFELESLGELLKRGEESEGLWNERCPTPQFGRLSDLPEFVSDVDLLGLPGRVANLVRFVLAVKPTRIQGTIHRFGDVVRFQVMLEGSEEIAGGEADDEAGKKIGNEKQVQVSRRDGRGASGEPLTRAPGDKDSRPCLGWSKELSADDRQAIPRAVKEIAHHIFLDLLRVKGFKSAESFMHYTDGLREHLAFNELKGRDEIGIKAMEHYQESIKVQRQNPLASYAIAQILYSSYDPDGNDKAIEEYQKALQTNIQPLQAKAFRGLADAYSQRVHRHHRGGNDVIDAAMIWAEFAQELCDAGDQASIKKALAFATQIQADRPGVKEAVRDRMIEEAMTLYQEAATCDPQFTVAHNNLGFLYLERAKKNLNALLKAEGDTAADLDGRQKLEARVVEDLQLGEECCSTAIRCDPTYHHAYDNLGNIWFERSRLPGDGASEAFKKAERYYYKAVAYDPRYAAAYADLARLYLRKISKGGESLAERAWEIHWRCLSVTGDPDARNRRCGDFRAEIRLISRGDWPVLRSAADKQKARTAGCPCLSEPWETTHESNQIHHIGAQAAGSR